MTILYALRGVNCYRTDVNAVSKVDRILVIDDDVELCALVAEYLEPEGFQVEAVYEGHRGLERAVSNDH